ncbi:MAG: tyrosine-type recombinase/integrase [Spirochaetia bacterium]|jgi:site-specific recombinase XerD|nr:tyrosine-type recombinase/integrase [Spirochaetia bacterium]
MNKYRSFMAHQMDLFVNYLVASNKWSETYAANLQLFDRYCASYYPDAEKLEQSMLEGWCGKRPTETGMSCRKRISCIKVFVEFLRKNGFPDVPSVEIPGSEKTKFIPHSFTESELASFFNACDNLPKGKSWNEQVRAISIPVFFRLLYSSGLRTYEARLLGHEDVNLDTGVVSIRHSKGPNEHFVVLHDSMLTLMKRYDAAIRVFSPDRKYFFTSHKNKHHNRQWVEVNFRELWDSCGFSYAIPYSLRHCYATTNINKWTDNDDEFSSQFVYLSKSMGHTVLESTRYYYSLTPAFSGIILDLCSDSFDAIVPEVEDAEKL